MNNIRFEERWKALLAQHEDENERLYQILRSEDDLIAVVLRGHLVIEQLLRAAIAAHCPQPQHLSSAHLRFLQLTSLLRSLGKLPMPEGLWDSLAKLNALRNAAAHRLEQSDLSTRVTRFVNAVIDKESQGRLPGHPGSKEALRTALAHLLGAMGMMAMFQTALEELIRHELRQRNERPEPPDIPQNRREGADA